VLFVALIAELILQSLVKNNKILQDQKMVLYVINVCLNIV